MTYRNCLLPVLCILALAVVAVSLVFVCGKANGRVWADYSALSAIISGIAFLGVLCTIYVQNKNAADDLRARHILLQIEMALRWSEFNKGDEEAQAEFLINIGYLEEELGKISGFDPDHVYWRRFKEKSIMKKSIPVEAVDG